MLCWVATCRKTPWGSEVFIILASLSGLTEADLLYPTAFFAVYSLLPLLLESPHHLCIVDLFAELSYIQ